MASGPPGDPSGAAAAEPFSAQLERWLSSSSAKTLSGLNEVFGERSFAVGVLVLMFPAALPLPTGGITHLLELVAVLLALQMVAGRAEIWLPARWRERELGAALTGKALPFVLRRVRSLERISRPRGRRLFDFSLTQRLLGLLLIAFAVGAGIAPPFSGLDTLPALGAVVVCLAIVLEDVLVLGIGTALGAAGITLSLTLGAAAFSYLTKLW